MSFYTNIKFSSDLIENKACTITYSGFLFQNNSDAVSIVYGFGNEWNHTTEQKMDKTEDGFVAQVNMLDFDTFNFCFKNTNYEWDNNNYQNYTSPISKQEPEEINFIINDDSVITNILDNLFEVDLSTIPDIKTVQTIETANEQTLEENIQTIETTEEPSTQDSVQTVEITKESSIEENIQTFEDTTFDIEIEENVPINIEDSLVNVTEAESLEQDIENIFNDIYQNATTEVQEKITKTEPVQNIEESVQEVNFEEITIKEQTTEVVENIVTEVPVQDTISEEIVNTDESTTNIENAVVENNGFNMNSLIDEILSPIVKSSVFYEETESLENYSPIQNDSLNFFDSFEEFDEDITLDNKIDNLIADLFNNTKAFSEKSSLNGSTTSTITTNEEFDKAIDSKIEEILSETPVVTENIETEVTQDIQNIETVEEPETVQTIKTTNEQTLAENIQTIETTEEPSTQDSVQTVEITEESSIEKNIQTVEVTIPEVETTEIAKKVKVPDFTIIEDDDEDEESLIETRDHTLEENSNTSLIEVPNDNDFVISPRSLGKFYMFKKKVKLAFTKLFVAIPKIFRKGFNTENN